MPDPGGSRIADVGEDGLVRGVVGRYPAQPPYVLVGPGDDAAVLDLSSVSPGPVVASTDTLVEGYDFRRDWSTAADVGVKTAAQNLADVAAMGARPLALLVSLAGPADLELEWTSGFADGLADECARAGASVVGGDVSGAPEIVVTGTALGVLPGRSVLRSGARAGDVVALAGVTGPSGAGLALLLAGRAGEAVAGGLEGLLTAHRAPRPPYPAGPEAAAGGATAMIDTSDGLLRDAARVASSSGVVLEVSASALAPREDLLAAAALLGLPPSAALEWALTGGEDHALLACFPPDVALPASFRPIGRVLPADDGGPRALVDGRPWTGSPGWTHFA